MKPSLRSLFLEHLKMGFLGFRETPSVLDRVQKFWGVTPATTAQIRVGDSALILAGEKSPLAVSALLLPTLLFVLISSQIISLLPLSISISSWSYLLSSSLQALLAGAWIWELLKKLGTNLAHNRREKLEQRYIVIALLVAFTMETTGTPLIVCLFLSMGYAFLHSQADLALRRQQLLRFSWESVFFLLPLAGFLGFMPPWALLVTWQEAFFLRGDYLSPSTFANSAVLAFLTPFPALSWALFLSLGLGFMGSLLVLFLYLSALLFQKKFLKIDRLSQKYSHTIWALKQGLYGGLAYLFIRLLIDWPLYLNWGLVPLVLMLLGFYLRAKRWHYVSIYSIALAFVFIRWIYDAWGGKIQV
jgi:hypothetical protein